MHIRGKTEVFFFFLSLSLPGSFYVHNRLSGYFSEATFAGLVTRRSTWGRAIDGAAGNWRSVISCRMVYGLRLLQFHVVSRRASAAEVTSIPTIVGLEIWVRRVITVLWWCSRPCRGSNLCSGSSVRGIWWWRSRWLHERWWLSGPCCAHQWPLAVSFATTGR